MTLVILAAGKNVRLDNGHPKSLSKIGNESLLERNISLFSAHGISDFLVVVGYRGDMVVSELKTLSQSYDVNINWVQNENYELKNGYSLDVARPWIEEKGDGEFSFVMADHFFDETFVENFFSKRSLEGETLLQLVVDKPGIHNNHIDLDDVTKVYSTEGRISRIGKKIRKYNYFDTGLFFVKKEIFSYLEKNLNSNRESISDLVQSIAQENKSKICEVTGYYWNDVDTPLDLNNTRNSNKMLEEGLLK